MDLGGVNDFGKKLETIKLVSEYEHVKGILLVRDAEKDANAASASIIDHVKRAWGIELPVDGEIRTNADGMRIGFFLLPGMDENRIFRNGTLEDLCWELIQETDEGISAHDLQSQTETHLKNITTMRRELKKPHKNRLHVLLSSTDKFVDMKIGEASQAGAFDFSSRKMSCLRERILQMQDCESATHSIMDS